MVVGVITAKKIMELAEASNHGPDFLKQKLIKEVGDISEMEIFGDNLLVAVYIGPEKIRGIHRAKETVAEDPLQANIGLVLKIGVGIEDADELLHKWVQFGYNDGLRLHYNEVDCRYMPIGRIRSTIPDPTKVL